MKLYKFTFIIELVTADESVDATEEPEHQVIVMDTSQENDSMGLVKEKSVSQKRYRQYICSSSNLWIREIYVLS